MKPFLAALPIAGLLASVSCSNPAPPPRPVVPHAAVTLARVRTEDFPRTFDAGGVVRARLTATIASRLLAPITGVRVRPGDRVTAGQVLVTLDGREMQAQADRAAAALAAAREGVRAADADRLATNAGLTLATAAFARIDGLHRRNSATTQEFEEATAALQTARARASGAEARAAEAAAALTGAESASSAAAIASSYSVIAAPFAGKVTERFADPGTMAAPGAPLFTLEDTSLFRLEVSLDEARASAISAGQRAAFTLDGATGGAWTDGRITEVARLDPARHSFVVKIDIPASAAAQSGAFGRARFSAGARAAVTAPVSAVVRRGQMTFVFAVDRDGLAHLRPVTIGDVSGDRLELLAGVADAEQVVDHPPPELLDGTRVAPGAGQ